MAEERGGSEGMRGEERMRCEGKQEKHLKRGSRVRECETQRWPEEGTVAVALRVG